MEFPDSVDLLLKELLALLNASSSSSLVKVYDGESSSKRGRLPAMAFAPAGTLITEVEWVNLWIKVESETEKNAGFVQNNHVPTAETR